MWATAGLVWVCVLAGCGRIGFAPLDDGRLGDQRIGNDDGTTDAFVQASCVDLGPICGPTGTDSCCASAIVAGGSFLRSNDNGTDGMYASTAWPAMVSPFRLDTYEVTVGRFRAFVDAGRGTQQAPPMSGDGSHPTIPASGWSTSFNASLATDTAGLRAALSCGAYAVWTDTPGTREDRAMSCVTWFEAMAFCAWDGGRLPTEAEWNYAAAGGSDQRPYPWSTPSTSTAIDETRASFYVDATLECYGDQVNGCTVDDNIRVGSRPAGNGAFGHADLAGNVFEWVLDTYATPYAMVPCMDCADLEQTNRVVRGGSLNGVRNDLRTAYRLAYVPGLRAHVFGFRCARAP